MIYKVMIAVGGLLWASMTYVYYKKFDQGIKARKKSGLLAYIGLGLLIGGLMETFRWLFESRSSMIVVLVLFITMWQTARLYVLCNVEYKDEDFRGKR